uniref:Cytochrome P450 n=1 Tax=Scoparia dulcis TaxID=107240 RepID=A0A1W7HBT6_SCODU
METILKFQSMIHQHVFSFPNIVAYPFILPALTSFIFLWFVTKWLYKLSGNKKNLPPSPPKLPILGNMHQLGSLPHQNLQSLAKKHGPVMLLQFGNVSTLIISSSDAAREIMKTHDLTFSNRPKSKVSERLLYNYKDVSVAPYGEYWRQLKSICVLQLLSNKRVQSFHAIREEETAMFINKIREASYSRSPVNLSEMFTQITNNVVCRSALGRKYGEGDDGKRFLFLLREFLEVLGTFSIGDFVPWLSWLNRVNGFDARVDKVVKEMDEFLEGVIRERLEISPEQKDLQGKNAENFVDILLGIYRENSTGVSFDRDSIKAIILDVFSAGTDTTSTVIEWAMTELLRHPECMKKLQNEVRGIIKDKQDITERDIEKMHYLKAVIKETLRCHTPIPLLVPRVASKDVKIMGYDVSAGTMVITNAWAIGRDPLIWDEPEKFNPERFFNCSIDYKGLDFELIPFGAGRRSCPGIAFAIASNELVLANLVKEFDWELPDGGNGKDINMLELPGVTIRRLVPLAAIPIRV